MKLDQFRKLCQREWMQEIRGDVKALSLTDESLEELTADVITKGPSGSWAELFRLGDRVDDLLNPVTRSEVKIAGGAASDTAEVDCGPRSEPRIVALT